MTGDKNEDRVLKEKNGEHPIGDAMQLALLGLFFLVWVFDSFFLHWTTFAAGYLSPPVRLIVAGILLLLGFMLAGAAHSVTGDDGGPGPLRTSSVFRYVRHPLYLGSLLFYIALTIATCSLISFGLLIVIFFFYDYIAGYEEKLMIARFGDEYRDYIRKTGKWIPRPGRG